MTLLERVLSKCDIAPNEPKRSARDLPPCASQGKTYSLRGYLVILFAVPLFSFASPADITNKEIMCPAESISPDSLTALVEHLSTLIGEDVAVPFERMFHCETDSKDVVELIFTPHKDEDRYELHREFACESIDKGNTWDCPQITTNLHVTINGQRIEVRDGISPKRALEIADYVNALDMSAFDLVGELNRSEFNIEDAKRMERIARRNQYYIVKTRIDAWSGYRLWIDRIDCGANDCDWFVKRVVPWRKQTN